MRILHLVHSLEASTGGTARAVEWLAAACARAGWETTIATAHVDAGSHQAEGVEVEAFPPKVGSRTRSGTAALRTWYEREGSRYDVIVSHGLWQFPTALPRLVRPARSIIVPHGMLDPWFKSAYPAKHLLKQLWWWRGEGRVVNEADAVVFTAGDEEARARGVFTPFHPRAKICPLGIPDPAGQGTDPAPLAGIGLSEGAHYVLFLARLHPKKGADLAVEAWKRLGPRTTGMTLVIAGPSEDAAHAEALRSAASSGLTGGRILFPGMATGALKWALLRHAEALILPSHQDNFGIAVAEALAVGTPVLLSRSVNIWREVEGYGAGFAADASVAGAQSQLERLLDAKDDERAAMRSAARTCFTQRFSSEVAAARWLEVFSGGSER